MIKHFFREKHNKIFLHQSLTCLKICGQVITVCAKVVLCGTQVAVYIWWLLSLRVTQSCWALVHFKCKPEPQCRVEGLSEPAENGVEVEPSVRGDIIEGQNASWPVQKNSDFLKTSAAPRKSYFCHFVIVPRWVMIIFAEQHPGSVISSMPRFIWTFVTSSFVSYTYGNSSLPLYLPDT